VGTQYRAGVYWTSQEERAAAEASREMVPQTTCASRATGMHDGIALRPGAF